MLLTLRASPEKFSVGAVVTPRKPPEKRTSP
jgi:hypothetical protein